MKNNYVFFLCPLASGSKGNCVYIGFGESAILVDAGLSGVEIELRMEKKSLSMSNVKAILITHDHTDHIKGAGVLSRRYGIPIYMTEETHLNCSKFGKIKDFSLFNAGDSFTVNGLNINSFPVFHDASDPVGYTMEFNNLKIGFTTDLGVVTEEVRENLQCCNLLYIESNHDQDMLTNGKYTEYLKVKIRSEVGHLSNFDSLDLLRSVMSPCLNDVVLAHLSEENNCPDLAYDMFSRITEPADIKLHVASQKVPGEVIEVR